MEQRPSVENGGWGWPPLTSRRGRDPDPPLRLSHENRGKQPARIRAAAQSACSWPGTMSCPTILHQMRFGGPNFGSNHSSDLVNLPLAPVPGETPSCHHTLPSCGQSLLRNHIITHSTLGGTVPIGTPSCHHSLLPAGQYVSPAAQVLSLPSRRGCCNAGRSARCLRTAPWWGSASEAQNTSASTPHGLFLKGSSVYKTRQTDLCSEADDFHSNVMCTTTLKGHTLQEKFNYLKLNLS